MPFILNGIIEEATTISSDEKQDIIFLGVTLCQICQLLCVRVLSLHALDIANELIILYCTVFEKVFPGQSTPNMVSTSFDYLLVNTTISINSSYINIKSVILMYLNLVWCILLHYFQR